MNKEIQSLLKRKNKIQRAKPYVMIVGGFFMFSALFLSMLSYRPFNSSAGLAFSCAMFFMVFFEMKQAKLNLAILEKINSIEENLKA